jgi:tetratricopeptide (TPR) repeat protein
LGEKEKTIRPHGAGYPVVCYLERATVFRPEDTTTRSIYGAYLAKNKKNKEAIEQLQLAEKASEDNANLHYNLGLVYADLGEFDKSLIHAHKAYSLGFTLPGLKSRLQKAGKWHEPDPLPADSLKYQKENPLKVPASANVHQDSKLE